MLVLNLIPVSKTGPWTMAKYWIPSYTNGTNRVINVGVKNLRLFQKSWWRHQIETFSAFRALCAGNSTVAGEFPSQRPVTRSFDILFDLRLKKRWVDNRDATVVIMTSTQCKDSTEATIKWVFASGDSICLRRKNTGRKHHWVGYWLIVWTHACDCQ